MILAAIFGLGLGALTSILADHAMAHLTPIRIEPVPRRKAGPPEAWQWREYPFD